jgi:hypothetical protein
MSQPVPACHDSSTQMRPACLQLWSETPVAPFRCLKAPPGRGDCYRELPRILLLGSSVNRPSEGSISPKDSSPIHRLVLL